MQIAVVGGSIAGCAAASVLIGDGHDVHVYERDHAALHGAGIAVQPDTFDTLVARELVPRDLPRIEVQRSVFAGPGGPDELLGRIGFEQSLPAVAMHWADLWRALRARVPDAAYHAESEVRAVYDRGARATLELRGGTRAEFELVVFADGYRSFGRTLVCPESVLDYRGYVLWRGLVPEALLADRTPLERSVFRLGHATLPGHSVVYSIPAGDGGVERARRLVNYACYLPLPAAELPAFLIDRDGRAHTSSLPPGSMRPSEEQRLKALLRAQLPPYFARLVEQGADTFAQPIYSVAPRSHRRGRLLLIGDAGALAQPLTGSGVLKAIVNALGLASQLRREPDLDRALVAWDARATAFGADLVRLGQQMEQALIWQLPDLGTLDAQTGRAFWERVVRVPYA